MYVHSPVARTFFCTLRVHNHTCTSSCVCSYTHGSSVCKKVFAYVSHLPISPSLVSCLTHLLLSPYDSLSLSLDFPVHTFLPYLLVFKAQGMRISARAAGSLAIWPSRPQQTNSKRTANEEQTNNKQPTNKQPTNNQQTTNKQPTNNQQTKQTP